MNEAKNYTIHVLTDQYEIKSDEPQEHIDASTDLVNELLQEIVEHNPRIDHKRAAVLVALRLASRSLHQSDELHQAQQKEQQLITDIEQRLTTSYAS